MGQSGNLQVVIYLQINEGVHHPSQVEKGLCSKLILGFSYHYDPNLQEKEGKEWWPCLGGRDGVQSREDGDGGRARWTLPFNLL